MKKEIAQWYEKKMERANTKLTLLDMRKFTFLILHFCMNLGLKSENKCMTKAQKENGEHIPQSVNKVQDKTLKYLTLKVVESREHN